MYSSSLDFNKEFYFFFFVQFCSLGRILRIQKLNFPLLRTRTIKSSPSVTPGESLKSFAYFGCRRGFRLPNLRLPSWFDFIFFQAPSKNRKRRVLNSKSDFDDLFLALAVVWVLNMKYLTSFLLARGSCAPQMRNGPSGKDLTVHIVLITLSASPLSLFSPDN